MNTPKADQVTPQSSDDSYEEISETAQKASKKPSSSNKAPGAFRTIREVAEILNVQQHVLRFWETKFNQVKPLKRGGGRRYYRPEDVIVLEYIHDLLYTQGYTIKGVQKLLKGKTKNQIVSDIASDEVNKPSSPAQVEAVRTNATATPQGRLSQKQRSILEAMLGELKEVRSIIKSD